MLQCQIINYNFIVFLMGERGEYTFILKKLKYNMHHMYVCDIGLWKAISTLYMYM